jgi:6-phosphogluconolactonase
MARQALLNHVAIPAANVHPISGIMPPDQAAWQYEELLREYFAGRPPQFDLVFLGLGENGHTASLWPGSEAIHEANRWVVAVFVPELDMFRVTMTAPLLNQAAAVVFLVTGAGKADVLREVLEGPGDVSRLPAQLIQPLDGKLGWLVEEASAAKLTRQS